MVDDITWSLSTLDAHRWGLQGVSLWRAPVTRRRTLLEVPGRHGVTPVGLPVFDEPKVTLKLWVHATTQAGVEAATMELVGLLSAPGLTLSRRSGDLVASAAADLVSVTPDEFTPAREATFDVVLAIPGVFLRGTPTVDAGRVVTSDDVVTVATLAGSTAPVTDAVLRITSPGTGVDVVDLTTGTGLSWAGALTAGQYLYLDAGRLRAWRSTNTGLWVPGGTDVTSGLDYPGAGPLQLWAAMEGTDPSDRRVQVAVTGTGFAATTALAVHAAPAYL